MENGRKSRWGTVRGVFFLVALLAGAILTPYALTASEPAKVFLLGAALLGLALWAKKHLKRQANP